MRIRVLHRAYGCDTGCTGHVICVDDQDEWNGEFEFASPGYKEDPKVWAQNWVREKFGEEHVKDLDWENSEVISD